jgi:hypothetical protein
VVLLQLARQEVPDGDADQQSNGSRVLESYREGQGRDNKTQQQQQQRLQAACCT